MADQPEAWLSGPVAGIPSQLQPAAHALMQARQDVAQYAPGLSVETLWAKRHDAATAGFHLLHMCGALDRLLTYARGERLNDAQKEALRAEAETHPDLDASALIARVNAAIDSALDQLRGTDVSTLYDERRIGRAGLPSTVAGCVFHAAEHTARHAGQFITTVRMTERST